MRYLPLAFAIALYASVSQAAIVATTDFAFFDSNRVGNAPVVVNFDSTTIGTTIDNGASFGGIRFDYGASFGAERLVITDGTLTGTALSTRSGTGFLGTTVNDQLEPAFNDFSFTVEVPASSIGLFVVISNGALGALDGDLRLSATNVTASLSLGNVASTLPDSSQVFFLGLIEDGGQDLGTVTLSSDPFATGYSYRIDDITYSTAVPEPASALLLACLGTTLIMRRRPVHPDKARDR